MLKEIRDFLGLIKRKALTIALVVVVILILTAIFTFVQPLKYGSTSRLLVVQNFSVGTDPFAMSKSNEYLSNLLATVVSANLFYEDVVNSGYNINKNYFSASGSARDELRSWRETAAARAVGDSGIIEVSVYHPDKKQLEQIAAAVNFILQSRHGQYQGNADQTVIKVIDQPITSAWPVKPNIILNFFLALAAGLFLAGYYIYFFPGSEYDLKLWKRRVKIEPAEEPPPVSPAMAGNQQWRMGKLNNFAGELAFQPEPEREEELPPEETAVYERIPWAGYGAEEKDIPLEGSMENILDKRHQDDL